MPTYEYECPVHGRIEVVKRMRDAGRDECCRACMEVAFDRNLTPEEQAPFVARIPWKMRRIYNPQRVIVRPRGYNLRPGERDPTVPGLSYSDFAHELARGELTEDATPVYTPESRARREAALAAEGERPRTLAEIDRGIPERGHQELHEWARAAYAEIEEARTSA